MKFATDRYLANETLVEQMLPIMYETKLLVTDHLIGPLADIVLDYMTANDRDWKNIAEVGEYETCLRVNFGGFSSTRGLLGALLGRNREIQKLMISRGAIESIAIGLYVLDSSHTWPKELKQSFMTEIMNNGWETTKSMSCAEFEKMMKDYNEWS